MWFFPLVVGLVTMFYALQRNDFIPDNPRGRALLTRSLLLGIGAGFGFGLTIMIL